MPPESASAVAAAVVAVFPSRRSSNHLAGELRRALLSPMLASVWPEVVWSGQCSYASAVGPPWSQVGVLWCPVEGEEGSGVCGRSRSSRCARRLRLEGCRRREWPAGRVCARAWLGEEDEQGGGWSGSAGSGPAGGGRRNGPRPGLGPARKVRKEKKRKKKNKKKGKRRWAGPGTVQFRPRAREGGRKLVFQFLSM